MKILFVIPYFYPAQAFGGPAKVAFDVGREMVKRGHEVVVFTSDAKDLGSRLNIERGKVEGIRSYYFRNLSMLLVQKSKLFITRGLSKKMELDLKSFDVIHVHECRTYQNIIVHKFATKYGIPYILQAHGSLPKIGRQARKWIYDFLFGRRILRDASKVIALSKTEAQQYSRMGVPEEKIAVMPNGIDLSEYTNLPPKGSFKKKFNIDEDKKVILYLGRIHKIKGIDFLVKAYAQLVNKMEVRDVLLVITGPDDGYLPRIQTLVKTLKIEDNVLISGPLYGKDKLEAYVDADVYVLPSRYEAFPMSVLEAVACGTPVILTENCRIADYFRDKVGIVVKPVANNLCEALLEMLLNQEKQNTYRKNCKSAIKEFEISKTVLKLEEVYERVVASFD